MYIMDWYEYILKNTRVASPEEFIEFFKDCGP